jgi:alkylated DNA repair protein (DNA oxidative demethylase)
VTIADVNALPSLERRPGRVDVKAGAVWLPSFVDVEMQQRIAHDARALLDGAHGGYVPTVRGGGKMHVRMLCLGRHWNPLTYRYESTRADYDGAPVAPIPHEWIAVARAAAHDAGFDVHPDVCLINHYVGDGRMGVHQDKDESAASLAAGAPIVSLSIGDTARFLFGGLRRRDRLQTIWLESGDAFVFGGAARLCYHGVTRIVPSLDAPVRIDGRINLTFRQF